MENIDELRAISVRIGGRRVDDGWDRLARYCGLPWSGGDDETWAFRYYDELRSPRTNVVRPEDVLAAAAMHPSLARSDLQFFHDERDRLTGWLEGVPEDRSLHGLDNDEVRHLSDLASWDVPVTLSLLTKVLHRKRPMAIPLVDRHVLDWYRPYTGERSAAKAWSRLLIGMREDLEPLNAIALGTMASAVEAETFARLSSLRILDIIVWMGGQR